MIHHTPWQTAPWPDVVDCIITDPPYSARTHTGNNGGRRNKPGAKPLRQIDYSAITDDDAVEWGREWGRRVRQWVCVLTDHTLIAAWQTGLRDGGLYPFAPVPCVIPGMTCRLAGDGPSSWAVYLVVARTKAAAKWGTLPGAYMVATETGHIRGEARVGGKPVGLMRQIIRDYSRPGMVVADPCCGYGTTLVAAAEQGREVWGCDTDAESVRQTEARIAEVKAQPNLFESPKQADLLGG